MLEGNRLAFQTRTEDDLRALTAHVQWVRDLRDTIAAGIKTYRMLLADTNVQHLKNGEFRDSSSIIQNIKKQNFQKIPSLNNIGAIRDVIIINTEYVLIFGSEEAANAALTVGLWYRKKNRACVALPLTMNLTLLNKPLSSPVLVQPPTAARKASPTSTAAAATPPTNSNAAASSPSHSRHHPINKNRPLPTPRKQANKQSSPKRNREDEAASAGYLMSGALQTANNTDDDDNNNNKNNHGHRQEKRMRVQMDHSEDSTGPMIGQLGDRSQHRSFSELETMAGRGVGRVVMR